MRINVTDLIVADQSRSAQGRVHFIIIWLQGLGAITRDPTLVLNNTRIQSPLPDYLYETEIKTLFAEASHDPRTYLLVLLFLDTGIKSNELFLLAKAHIV